MDWPFVSSFHHHFFWLSWEHFTWNRKLTSSFTTFNTWYWGCHLLLKPGLISHPGNFKKFPAVERKNLYVVFQSTYPLWLLSNPLLIQTSLDKSLNWKKQWQPLGFIFLCIQRKSKLERIFLDLLIIYKNDNRLKHNKLVTIVRTSVTYSVSTRILSKCYLSKKKLGVSACCFNFCVLF